MQRGVMAQTATVIPEHPAFFTTSTLARHVQLSERTIRDLLRSGEIPSYKLGGARRIAASDVHAWLAQHRQNGAK